MRKTIPILLIALFLSASACSTHPKKMETAMHDLVVKVENNAARDAEATIKSVPMDVVEGLEIPKAQQTMKEKVLERKGYTVSFNMDNNIPNWVAWRLTKDRMVERVARANHFYPDPDFPRSVAVETSDYSNSGWDRGHMCPAYDNKWDEMAMRESFYMTNICPQHHNLNRGDWKELEEDCRRWVEETDGAVYIVCGPVLYKKAEPRFIGKEHQVRVPDAFFKVVLKGVEQGNPQAVGFLYKNAAGNQPLDVYVNSVDQVERITGLDFFPALPDDVENRIEAECNIDDWK